MRDFLRLIRFSHSIFAAPFALGVYFIGKNEFQTSPLLLIKIIIALFCARTFAMLCNRLLDWQIDKRNPRTSYRHKLVEKKVVILTVFLSLVIFILSSLWINKLCFYFSPLAAFILFFYSLCKRFTNYSQLFLGIALGLAPLGTWIALSSQLPKTEHYILALAVIFWVAGFDSIYATLDETFDSQQGLHSLAVKFGKKKVIKIAFIFHLLALALFFLFGYLAELGWKYHAIMMFAPLLIIYENKQARLDDDALLNKAFFLANAVLSVLFLFACVIA